MNDKSIVKLLKNAVPDVACILFFLLLAFFYFKGPISDGLVLGGHDSVASVGQGREQIAFKATHDGETPRWTNTLFSGMPTYQIAPSYDSAGTLSTVEKVYSLGTTGVLCYVFLYMLGFYILLRAFNFRPWLAALGAVVWAFSSYFFIIIAAGHIWKVMTLTFIPPTIAGLVLCYRGRYLWGGAVTALFTALQIHANHVQMTYYFLFLMALIVIAYGVKSLFGKKKEGSEPSADDADARAVAAAEGEGLTKKRWAIATLVIVIAGLVGAAANVSNLYHTYEYSKHSMRGPAELTPKNAAEQKQATKGGLERDYITQWSYGIGETWTLLVPDYKGGGSTGILDREDVEDLEGYDSFYHCAGYAQQAMQQAGAQANPPGVIQYWGDQPMTVGPVYVGAFVCFLFVLGLFFVRGPMKWALLAGTVLSFLFAWGHNDPWFTNFCIDHLPMYNKFRTPSSALVVAEFCMPLLAVMALAKVLRSPEQLFGTRRGKVAFSAATLLTAGACLLFWLAPGAAGDCISQNDHSILTQLATPLGADYAAQYADAITSMHHDILSASALRSLIYIIIGMAVMVFYVVGMKRKDTVTQCILAVVVLAVCLVDMWQVNSRYLVTDTTAPNCSFVEPQALQNIEPTAADKVVQQDKGDYRVLNISEGNPFNETSNHTAYFFQSIGGYNAAKLHRYQDMIDNVLSGEIQRFVSAVNQAEGDMQQVPGDTLAPMLNALNAKYVIFGKNANQVVQNPYAAGNGWFVSSLSFVKGADAEMAATQKLQPKHAAVADEQFRAVLEGTPLDSGTVRLTKREANCVEYDVQSPRGGVAVLSEVYYPGWSCTIDGKPADVARVDYILRAIKVEAGSHKVVMTYKPESVTRTETVAYTALALVLLAFIAAIAVRIMKRKKGETTDTKEEE